MPAITKTYPPHAMIFNEGDEATYAYVIVRGSVEIVLNRAGKVITLDTLGQGHCFGEMGPLTNRPRIAGARTTEPTDLLLLGSDDLKAILNQSTPVARTVVQSLVDRVKRLDEAAIQGFTPKYSMVALARLLVLMSHAPSVNKAEAKPDARQGARPAAPGGAAAHGDLARLPYEASVESMADILCTVGYRIKDALKQMEDVNLLTLENGSDGRFIKFRTSEIVDHSARMEKSLGALLEKRMTAEVELCDLDELARHAGFDADKAFRKLVAGDVPRELFLFRKQLALELVKQNGKDILERRKFKRPAEFETLEDLEFLDDDALRAAFSQLETLDQAVVIRGARADISDRLASTLSQRMRDIVQKAASGLERLDDVKLRILERKLIDLIKAADAADSRTDAGGAA